MQKQEEKEIKMLDMAQPQAVDTANQPEGAPVINDAQQSGERDDAFLMVRYNKDELPLSREAAAKFAQKGLNYDKLSGKLEKAQELLAAYQDIGEAAKDYARINGISELDALAAIKMRLAGEQQKQAAVSKQLDEFLQAHPDVDPRVLPVTVVDAWRNGTPLIEAYDSMRKQEQQRELARQTNAQNTALSMGGAVGTGAAAPRPITEDGIKLMSSAELEKNHSRIWAFLTGQK